MSSKQHRYELFTMGRSSIDLYANDVGARFVDIKSFAAYVGGSPLNIAVGAQRLNIRTGLLTAVGADPVGDFIMKFLMDEGIDTQYIPRKPSGRSSAVVLGIEPPDRFPLVYYRENAADSLLTIDDALALPYEEIAFFEFSGTGLSREPARSATILAVERARAAGCTVVFDLDFRFDQWHDPRAFGVVARSVLPLVDIAIGTEEEVLAAMLQDPADISISDSQISAPKIRGDVEASIQGLLRRGAGALVVKRGSAGASIYAGDAPRLDVPGFPVEVYNVLGAGDAFASGFIYGRLKGWDWYRSGRMGNACGAIVVTRHGCANFMGYESEVLEFVESHGGF